MAILVCKDAFNRYTPIWVNQLKRMGVNYLLVPAMSLKVDHNSIDYWVRSLWLLARNFDIHVFASSIVGKNYTEYPSFGHAMIINNDTGIEKEGSEKKEELLMAKIRCRSAKEIMKSYRSKWQPIVIPKVRIVNKV